MQVYRFMDIGTAKPATQDLQKVKHHLIDILTPDQQFTAGEFKRNAEELIKEIHNNNKIPFLVGGTGLYFTSLIRGMIEMPEVDQSFKKQLSVKSGKIGQSRMYGILKRLDPDYAHQIHPNDNQRTLRALEIILGTKKKFSFYLKQENKKTGLDFLNIGIRVEREKLYEIINNRVDKMIESGLVDEVKRLLEIGYDKNSPGMKAIGYKEIISFLENRISLDKAIDEIKKNSRHYAKRQFTWFNALKDVNWFDVADKNKIKEFILTKIK
jgi:tRNA dimethylallyltransferase